MLVPFGSQTSYIDAMPASYWKQFEYWKNETICEPDIIDEGATLATIADDSFDYLIAAHVLEHIDDPIGALKNWVRVVKPGGHLVIAVPDKRYSAEDWRDVTSIEHLKRDHEEGPGSSIEEHYAEMNLNPEMLQGEALIELRKKNERLIHWHAFTLTSYVNFLTSVSEIGYDLLEASLNVNEDIAVLKVTKGYSS